MTCDSCGYTKCDCRRSCDCCQYDCWCMECVHVRLRLRAPCCPCGGRGICPKSRFRDPPHHSNNGASEKTNMENSVSKATQTSPMATGSSVPETSPSPPMESSTFDDSLIFQMDDIDTSKVPTNTITSTNTGARSKVFQGSSHFSSNKSASYSIPFDQREPPSRLHRCCHHNPDAASLKRTESPKCKKPISNPLQIPDATDLKLRESQENKIPVTTQDVAGCLHHNTVTSISEIKESLATRIPQIRTVAATEFNRTELLERETPTTTQDIPCCCHYDPNGNYLKLEESDVTKISPEPKLHATDLKWTESPESEMMINKDIPGCSYQSKYFSKREESQTDSASSTLSSADEYASESLPSSLSFDSQSPSFRVSLQSPSRQLSSSAPAICDLPEPTELKSLEQKTSTALDTTKQPPTLNLPKSETLKIPGSLPLHKSRSSSESSSSVEILPANMPNGARYDAVHGQPGIPSTFKAPNQLSSTVMQTEFSLPGTSQTLLTSNSLKLPSPVVSKSPRRTTSSESDSSIETISREQGNDNSDDEAHTNESQKRKLT